MTTRAMMRTLRQPGIYALLLAISSGFSANADAAAQVVLSASQSSSTVAASQVNVYQITVSNTGNATSSSFSLIATVPNNTTVSQAQASGGGCSGASWPCQPGQQITWYPVSVAAGQSQSLQFSAQVNPSTPDGTSLSTTVTTSLVGSSSIVVQSAVRSAGGLNVGLSCPPAAVSGPDNFPCLATYSNSGGVTANANLAISFSSSLTGTSASNGGSAGSGGGQWNLGSLPPGTAGQQWLTVQVPGGFAAGSVTVESAQLSDSSGGLATTAAALPTAIAGLNPLPIAVSAAPDPVQPGQVVVYSIVISNPTATSSPSFELRASVPNGTTVAQGQAGGAGCTGSVWPCQPGQQVEWYPLSIGAGQSVTLQFGALVNSGSPPAAGSLLTSVITTGWGGQAVAQAVVGGPGPALTISAPGQVGTSGQYTYTLTYGNAGTTTANTTLLMPVPVGTGFVSASDGVTPAGNGVLSWSFSGLAPGEAISKQVRVTAPNGAGKVIEGTAEVVDSNTQLSYGRATTQTTLASTNAVQVAVSATPDPVQPGQTVTYSITLSNTTSTSTPSFSLRASVPNGTTISQAQAGGGGCTGSVWPCQPGQDIDWYPVAVAAGQSQTFQFNALVNSGSPPNNGSPLTTVITTGLGAQTTGQALVGAPAPTLSMSAPGQVSSGGQYTYTLTYGNSGTSTPDTQLLMSLPVGTSFVSATGGATPSSSGVLSWNLNALAPGAAGSQQVTVTAPTAAGTIVNAIANVLDLDSGQSYSRAGTQTTVASSNPLQIGVNATPDPVQPGQVVVYSIVVSNPNTSNSGTFTLRASVPTGVTVSQAQAGGGGCTGSVWPCQPGQEIDWYPVSVGAGQSQTFQFGALVNSGAPPSNGTVLSTVITTNLGGQAIGQALVGAPAPTLSISAPQQVVSGATYTYTLTCANSGGGSPNTRLIMALPVGTVFVSATGGVTPSSNGVLTWNLGALGPGVAVSQQVTVQAQSSAASVIDGSAEVLDVGTLQSYSRASTQTTIASTNPLQVAVSTTPDPAVPGQTVTYSIVVSNPNTSSSGTFTLRASVPNGVTISQAQAGGGGCTGSVWPCQPGQEIDWYPVTLGAGQSETFQFAAVVNSGAPPSNGSLLASIVTTNLGGQAMGQALVGALGPTLSLSAPDQVSAGGSYTYTLTYANSGSSAAAVQLAMSVPVGTTFLSASGGVTPSSTGMLTWNLGTLQPG